MLQIENLTPYSAERAALVDLDGSEIWVVAVKATYTIVDGRPVLADEQETVRLVDEYYGEPGQSSVKYEGELVFRKPGTDVVINGHAYAPPGRTASRVDAAINIGSRRKVVRVYGDRVWEGGRTGLAASRPQPFERVPLIYERAFGGTDTTSDDPAQHAAEYRNPIGAGFAVSPTTLRGRPLPNLEDPANEITSWKSRPRPIGVGFTGRHWEPRRRYSGTCDERYIQERLPLYPVDFDLRFFLGAPEDLTFAPHLRGGETFELYNLTPNGYLSFVLPKVALGFQTSIAGAWVDHRATLGQVVIEPDVPRVMLTWQTFTSCHRKTLQLKETRIFEKQVM